jgi:hypothetical protein
MSMSRVSGYKLPPLPFLLRSSFPSPFFLLSNLTQPCCRYYDTTANSYHASSSPFVSPRCPRSHLPNRDSYRRDANFNFASNFRVQVQIFWHFSWLSVSIKSHHSSSFLQCLVPSSEKTLIFLWCIVLTYIFLTIILIFNENLLFSKSLASEWLFHEWKVHVCSPLPPRMRSEVAKFLLFCTNETRNQPKLLILDSTREKVPKKQK